MLGVRKSLLFFLSPFKQGKRKEIEMQDGSIVLTTVIILVSYGSARHREMLRGKLDERNGRFLIG